MQLPCVFERNLPPWLLPFLVKDCYLLALFHLDALVVGPSCQWAHRTTAESAVQHTTQYPFEWLTEPSDSAIFPITYGFRKLELLMTPLILYVSRGHGLLLFISLLWPPLPVVICQGSSQFTSLWFVRVCEDQVEKLNSRMSIVSEVYIVWSSAYRLPLSAWILGVSLFR